MNLSRSIVVFVALSAAVCSLPALAEEAPKYSGFIGDDSAYARLQEVKLHKGITAKRWFAPHLSPEHYQSAMVDDVVLYPTPQPTAQVSAKTLGDIRDYLSSQLQGKIATILPAASAKGAGVVEIQAAITGVAVKTEGLHAYELVPVSAIFHGVQAARGKRAKDVQAFIEVRLLDSESRELIGAIVRPVEGEKLKGKKDQLQLSDMENSLNQATDDASAALATIF